MLMQEAKKVIESRGIEVSEVESMKGACRVSGLTLGSGRIKPTIYARTFEEAEDEDEVMRIVDRAMEQSPDVNVELILQRDYVVSHCISCIRHETDDESVVKWKVYGDLEEIIRIRLGETSEGDSMTVTVRQGILDSIGMTADELRTHARENLRKEVRIQSMGEVMREMMGNVCPDFDLSDIDEVMYVASNGSRINGAAVMLLDDVLEDFCEKHDLKQIFLIPSSIHEILITPVMNKDSIDDMIREVNMSQVDEWDRLSDHVYLYEVA